MADSNSDASGSGAGKDTGAKEKVITPQDFDKIIKNAEEFSKKQRAKEKQESEDKIKREKDRIESEQRKAAELKAKKDAQNKFEQISDKQRSDFRKELYSKFKNKTFEEAKEEFRRLAKEYRLADAGENGDPVARMKADELIGVWKFERENYEKAQATGTSSSFGADSARNAAEEIRTQTERWRQEAIRRESTQRQQQEAARNAAEKEQPQSAGGFDSRWTAWRQKTEQAEHERDTRKKQAQEETGRSSDEKELIKREEQRLSNLLKMQREAQVRNAELARIGGAVVGSGPKLLYPAGLPPVEEKSLTNPLPNKPIVFEGTSGRLKAEITYNRVRDDSQVNNLKVFAERVRDVFKDKLSFSVYSGIFIPYALEVLTKLGVKVTDPDIKIRITFEQISSSAVREFSRYSGSTSADVNEILQASLHNMSASGASVLYLDELIAYFNYCRFFAFRFELNGGKKYVEICFNHEGTIKKLPESPFEKLKQLFSGEKPMIEGQEPKQLYPAGAPAAEGPKLLYPAKEPKLLHGRTVIDVYPPSITLSLGSSQQFTASVHDPDGNEIADANVSWSIDNSSVGELRKVYWDLTKGIVQKEAGNKRCVVKAVGPGTAVVTATANGATGTAIFTVNPGQQPPPEPPEPEPEPTPKPEPEKEEGYIPLLKILVLIIGLVLFEIEVSQFGGGEYVWDPQTFVIGAAIIGIAAVLAEHYKILNDDEEEESTPKKAAPVVIKEEVVKKGTEETKHTVSTESTSSAGSGQNRPLENTRSATNPPTEEEINGAE